MIICSVCQTKNDQYSTICKQCGGYLQNRVQNLDLFDTLWKIIENPKKGFILIMTAEHKNFAVFLYALLGISISFANVWYFELGNRFANILLLIFWTLIIGLPLGIILCPGISLFHCLLSKMFGGKASFRSSIAITSYASTPIILSLFFVLPIELMTFGIYLFTFNPHPMAIKPISYILLIGLDSTLFLWTFILTIIGTNIGNQMPVWRSFLVVIILYTLILIGFGVGSEYVLKMF